MCRPTGSWFWSSWFRTGYPFRRRFLERGIILQTHESSSFVSSHLKLFKDRAVNTACRAELSLILRSTQTSQVVREHGRTNIVVRMHGNPKTAFLWIQKTLSYSKQHLSEDLRISRSKLSAQAFSTTIQGPNSRPVGRHKLRTFRQFKIVYDLENYLSAIENFEHRHRGDQKPGSLCEYSGPSIGIFSKIRLDLHV